jgi:hypothetical protein
MRSAKCSAYRAEQRCTPKGIGAIRLDRLRFSSDVTFEWDPDDLDAWINDLKTRRRSVSIGATTGLLHDSIR